MWFTSKEEKQKEVIIAFRPGDRISLVITAANFHKTLNCTIKTCTASEIKINAATDNDDTAIPPHSQGKIQILKPVGDHFIYTEGASFQPAQKTISALIVYHNNVALVTERRTFQLIGLRKKVRLIPISEAGQQIAAAKMVSVMDISPTGIGIRSLKKYSLKTCFKLKGLFLTPEHDESCADYLYQFVWRRGNFWLGYRYGAVFTFSSPEDIRRLSFVLEKIQFMNLTKQYQHILSTSME